MTAPITQITDWQTLSPADMVQQLGEIVETRKPADATRNETAWATGARGLRDFGPGPDGWGGMIAKLVDLGYGDVANQLTYGMDFGDPSTQAMIDQLGVAAPDVFTPDRVAILKAWGVDRAPRWQRLGYESLPSIEQVESEQARELAVVAITDRLNAAKAAMSTAYDAVQTGQQITAAAEAAWAGE